MPEYKLGRFTIRRPATAATLFAAASIALTVGAGVAAAQSGSDGSAAAAVPPDDAASMRIVNGVVAAVDGNPITLRDLDVFGKGRGRLLPAADQASQQTLLQALIRSYLFRAEFQDAGIVSLDSDVETYIEGVLKQTGSTREELRMALEDLGISWEDYFERMREETQRLALINYEIRARVNVSPEEIERYWEQEATFDLPDRRQIADIYIPLPTGASSSEIEAARANAEVAYKMAKRAGFAEAARSYSKGPTADSGGILGEFATGTLAPEFEAALADLDKGEVSRPFDFEGAIHIVKLVREIRGGRVSLEEVEDEIREKLYVEHLDTRFKRWVEEDLRERHHVIEQLDAMADASPASFPSR